MGRKRAVMTEGFASVVNSHGDTLYFDDTRLDILRFLSFVPEVEK